MSDIKLCAGDLLIASPKIEKGFYHKTVVLLCDHKSQEGAFGIILNKELNVDIPHHLFPFLQNTTAHVKIKTGGPVQPNQLLLLHNDQREQYQKLTICSNVYLGGDIHFLQECATSSLTTHLNLCFGYCGWVPNQLEKECEENLWFLSKGSEEIVFSLPPHNMWEHILHQMGGEYCNYASIPDDLSLN